MKKLLFFFIACIALLLIYLYVFIPNKLIILTSEEVKVNEHAANRYLNNEANLQKVFAQFPHSNFRDDINFKTNRSIMDGVEILMSSKGETIPGKLEVVRLNYDSSLLNWSSVIDNGFNPVDRFRNNSLANELKKRLNEILDTIKPMLESEQTVYGMTITRTTVKDTLLISTSASINHYPETQDIYGLIQSLRNYAASNNAVETGFPMLNIKNLDSGKFEAKVALPINKELKDQGTILHKEMVPGNILVAEIKGGPYTVSTAFDNLHYYVTDHDLQSPAIPFQSLITDRSKQPDSTEWITKIYYPIY